MPFALQIVRSYKMNRCVPLALFSLLCLGFISSGRSQPSDSRLTEVTYAFMTREAADAKTTPRMAVVEHEIEVQPHRIELFPILEDRRAVAGKNFVSVRLDVSVDGRAEPNLSLGAIGIDESPEAAERTAIAEWYLQFGQSMFEALASSKPNFMFGEYSVYQGALGLRGGNQSLAADPSLSAEHMISALKELLPTRDGRLHVVYATVVVAGDGKVDGQIRIDGNVSAAAWKLLGRQPWPKYATSYMYKQSLVLK